MREERGVSTREILHGEPVFSIEDLTAATKDAIKQPSPEISGQLTAQPSKERGKV